MFSCGFCGGRVDLSPHLKQTGLFLLAPHAFIHYLFSAHCVPDTGADRGNAAVDKDEESVFMELWVYPGTKQ